MFLSFGATVKRNGTNHKREEKPRARRPSPKHRQQGVNRGALHLFRQLLCDSRDANSLHIVCISTTSCSVSASRPEPWAVRRGWTILTLVGADSQMGASAERLHPVRRLPKQKPWKREKAERISLLHTEEFKGPVYKISPSGQGKNCNCCHY